MFTSTADQKLWEQNQHPVSTKLGKAKRSNAACSSSHISAVSVCKLILPAGNCAHTRRSFSKERNPAWIKVLKLSPHDYSQKKERKNGATAQQQWLSACPGLITPLGVKLQLWQCCHTRWEHSHNRQQVTRPGDVRGGEKDPPVLCLKLRLHLSPRIWIILKGKEILLSRLLLWSLRERCTSGIRR